MPCQAEEEVNQLAYVQKHLPSLLALLAESTEDGENDTKVCNVLIKNLEFLFYLNFVLKSAAAF
jgi:TBCC domain-containing protein 1